MVEARGGMPILRGEEMQSLYEQNPEAWEKLAREGKPSLGKMARHFYTAADMDKALGFDKAVAHWLRMRNGANFTSERRAAEWLACRAVAPAAQAASAIPAPDGVVLLVVCPGDKADKVRRVLAMMGCEVDE
jgi:hypothetical protein